MTKTKQSKNLNIKQYYNREISWLQFNERVLEQANDEKLPILERLKFLAITGSNLDEFFMVRVGGLQTLVTDCIQKRDPSGLTPQEQLNKIDEITDEMVTRQYKIFDNIRLELGKNDIKSCNAESLTISQRKFCEKIFENEIFPLLTPVAIEEGQELPLFPNGSLLLGFRIKNQNKKQSEFLYTYITLGKIFNRFIKLPSENTFEYILLEDLVAYFGDRLFPGQMIIESFPFRILRNADMSVREDMASDLLSYMEELLDERKRGGCVRFETSASISKESLSFFKTLLSIDNSKVSLTPGPLDISIWMKFCETLNYPHLKIDSWLPQHPSIIDQDKSIMESIDEEDIVLIHPYESFEPVVRFINEAADDPDVVTIKQILYRTSRSSPIVDALIRAVEHGKLVTAVIELKARFDEQRNIEWARELEDAGVQVIYGVRKLKTHAKACLVIKRIGNGLKRYVHVGTGNYNEITAQQYSDISFFTCDEDFGADISAFFNCVTGYSEPNSFRKISMAPIGLREKILEFIELEKQNCQNGLKSYIRAKMNSLVDPEIISALYKASMAGVKIELNIRGICCLKAGILGLSENIYVTSIIDRYLEHARIFHFCHNSENRVFISTADWMPRNLDKRIELLVPIEDQACKGKLISILDTYFIDNQNSWHLNTNGVYTRNKAKSKQKPIRAQEVMYQMACKDSTRKNLEKKRIFHPHFPKRERAK